MSGSILLTGGCGYIGSHIATQLLAAGEDVVLFDNLCNCDASVTSRIGAICGRAPDFVQGDVRDRAALDRLFRSRQLGTVIHLAGLKSIAAGETMPHRYLDNNVEGSRVLFEAMDHAGVHRIVFSSSATVYGNPGVPQYREDMPLAPVTVYGRTKLLVEDMLRARQQQGWRVALLRYFNPAGAHASGLIGEAPAGAPENLMPMLAQVALGQRDRLQIFGNDHPTPDGTCLRDYIHVEDLAAGHLAALAALSALPAARANFTLNLGTGQPHSVLEMVNAFGKASGRDIPCEAAARRTGDLPAYHADPALARRLLGWQAKHGIARMCADAWLWAQHASCQALPERPH